jgi:tetratricopeptide (TPR) repeat protein
MSKELPPDIRDKVTALAVEGDGLVERAVEEAADERIQKGVLRAATGKYIAALELLPQPMEEYPECRTLLTNIGNANFLAKAYQYALPALQDAMHCQGAIGNPFNHLRLGQTQFELGNMERAADELARAYLMEGRKIFASEDPKYLTFIKSKLLPPPGGWPEGW